MWVRPRRRLPDQQKGTEARLNYARDEPNYYLGQKVKIILSNDSSFSIIQRPQHYVMDNHFGPSFKELAMAMVRCEVAEGLRPSEVVASIIDIRGRTHYIRVERSFISTEGGQAFLPIGIIGIDPNQSAVLIELPHEAETGVHRLWVTAAQFDQPLEALV